MARKLTFTLVITGIFLFPGMICHCGEEDGIGAKINLVFEDGRVMMYQGKDSGLKKGQTYEVVMDGGVVGEVKIAEVEALYTVADIETGEAPGAWEGRDVTLVAKGEEGDETTKKKRIEKEEEEEEEKPKKETEERKTRKIEERIAEKEYEEPVTRTQVPVPEEEEGKGDRYIANSMLRYETHDSRGAPDDYINYMLLVSRLYPNDLIGNAYIYNSYNKSDDDNAMTLYGMSIVKLYPRDVMASIGYGYMVSHISGGARRDRDTDVFSASVQQIFQKYKDGHEWSGAIFYSNTEGYIDSASLTGKLTYQHLYDDEPSVKGRYSVLFNHNPEESRYVSTQFSAIVMAQWRPRTKYSLEYLYTDYARDRSSGLSGALDNDNTFRFSIYHRH
ncbi:MAG: hypothetical protein ABIH66_03210 [bacterium]